MTPRIAQIGGKRCNQMLLAKMESLSASGLGFAKKEVAEILCFSLDVCFRFFKAGFS